MLRIGWFSTGRGEGSLGLLRLIQERIASGDLDARIEFVFCNRERGEAEGSDQFLAMVEGFGLPLATFSSARFRQARGGGRFSRLRAAYDQEVMARLASFQPDVCALAGYMLIVSGEMCRRYPLLNLHPALPDGPAGTWQDVVWQLIEQRAERTGAMLHIATEELDSGPVVAHYTVPLRGPEFAAHWAALEGQDTAAARASQGENFPLFQLIRQAQYRKEPYFLLETLRAVALGKVRLAPEQVFDRQGRPLQETRPWGYCLDTAIGRAMGEDNAG